MQQDEQHIIDTLGIGALSEDAREPILIEANMRIGNAILDTLDDEQFDEYTAIVDDNQDVIYGWLEANVPDYKDNATYKAIEEGFESDPERNNPAKIFATLAWLEVNIPDVPELVAETLEAYKQELATTNS